jgi:hypothetical protein
MPFTITKALAGLHGLNRWAGRSRAILALTSGWCYRSRSSRLISQRDLLRCSFISNDHEAGRLQKYSRLLLGLFTPRSVVEQWLVNKASSYLG